MKQLSWFALVLLAACSSSKSAVAADSSKLAAFHFLVGEWDGVATGAPGNSVGSFNVNEELGGTVLVRRGFNQSAAGLHEDLMVIYPEATGFRADYWDTESHALHYHVYPQPADKQVVMESSPLPDGTQFRLSYKQLSEDSLEVRFDLAPAGKDYAAYLQGTVKRRKK